MMNAPSILLGTGNAGQAPQAPASPGKTAASAEEPVFLLLMAQALGMPLANLLPQTAAVPAGTGANGGGTAQAGSTQQQPTVTILPGPVQQQAAASEQSAAENPATPAQPNADGRPATAKSVPVDLQPAAADDVLQQQQGRSKHFADLLTNEPASEQQYLPADTAQPAAAPERDVKTPAVQAGQHNPAPIEAPAPQRAVQAEAPAGRVLTTDGTHSFDDVVLIAKDGNRLAVTLEPDGFGKMNLHLTLDKGMVNAQLQVADDALRNLLGNNIQQLLDALAREGVSIGGFSISLGSNGNTGGEGFAGESAHAGSARNEATAGIQAPAAAGATGLVSIFA